MAVLLRRRRVRDPRPPRRIDNIAVAAREAKLAEAMGPKPKARSSAFLRKRVSIALPATVQPPFAEQVLFPLPEELLTGDAEMDENNTELSVVYETIAALRQELHELEAFRKKDSISFSRMKNCLSIAIHKNRVVAEALRDEITASGGLAMQEPDVFGNPI